MKCVRAVILGKVQGVFFREFIQKKSRKLGINGYAKNVDLDKVEAVLQGEEAAINKIIELCKSGPPLAMVKQVNITDFPIITRYDDFKIL